MKSNGRSADMKFGLETCVLVESLVDSDGYVEPSKNPKGLYILRIQVLK